MFMSIWDDISRSGMSYTLFLIYLDIHLCSDLSRVPELIQQLGTGPAVHVRTVPGIPVVDLHFLDATDEWRSKLGTRKSG